LEQIQLADSLARLNLLLEKTMKILAMAEDNNDQKFMLQAIREAERLTKLIHSLSPEQEAASLLMETTDPSWNETGATPRIQQETREKVRRSIKQSLRTPCAGSKLEADLPPEPASPPAKPLPAVRKVRAPGQPRRPLIPWLSARREATIVSATTALPDAPTAVEEGRAAPG
jgi:hypothetical protein